MCMRTRWSKVKYVVMAWIKYRQVSAAKVCTILSALAWPWDCIGMSNLTRGIFRGNLSLTHWLRSVNLQPLYFYNSGIWAPITLYCLAVLRMANMMQWLILFWFSLEDQIIKIIILYLLVDIYFIQKKRIGRGIRDNALFCTCSDHESVFDLELK